MTRTTLPTACPSCGRPAEELTCADCGRTATVIDCGDYPQPAEIAASAHAGGDPVCARCERRRDSLAGVFYRPLGAGQAQLFHESGEVVERLPGVTDVYPVGSLLSVQYQHPQGIVLSVADAHRLGIPAE